jgi:hypothetical protein
MAISETYCVLRKLSPNASITTVTRHFIKKEVKIQFLRIRLIILISKLLHMVIYSTSFYGLSKIETLIGGIYYDVRIFIIVNVEFSFP